MRKRVNPAPRGKPWVLVADRARARLFTITKSNAPLVEVEDLLNPSGRLRERELDSDSRGRLIGGRRGAGHGGHAAARSDAPRRDQDTRQFARTLCNRLSGLREQGKLSKLYVIAEPDFLGLLRQQMAASVQSLVARELNKNLTRAPSGSIRESLPARL